jgi:predicted nucleic acid-binding protein
MSPGRRLRVAPAGLLDTGVLIAAESGRALDTARLPLESFVSVITLAELHAGVLAATSTQIRARRLATLESLGGIEALPIDAAAAVQWATMRVRLAEEGRRINVNDLWIAAVAAANDLPIVTQDDDFDALADVGGPDVVRV